MQTVLIGDLTVPPLAVGAMFWGTDVPDERAHALLDAAVDGGATFVDTANNYAVWREGATGDESENCLGHWLASRGPGARGRITLATKVGARPVRPGAAITDSLGLRPAAVAAQLRDSLRRLGTDHVDLVYAHIDDRSVPMAEAVHGLQQLVDAGLTRAIAASNLSADRLTEALDSSGDGPSYCALQSRFTYLPVRPGVDIGRQVVLTDDVIEVARSRGVALLGYSTLLSGAYTRTDRELPAMYEQPGRAAALAALRAAADGAGLDHGQAVLSWMVHRDDPVIPIVGLSRPEQLDSAIRAVSTPMPADNLLALDQARLWADDHDHDR